MTGQKWATRGKMEALHSLPLLTSWSFLHGHGLIMFFGLNLAQDCVFVVAIEVGALVQRHDGGRMWMDRVEAGGGNSTAPLTVFVPQSIKIKAGQSVNWYNPTPLVYPHSVFVITSVHHHH